MARNRKTLFGIWLLTSLLVAGAAFVAYRQITRVPGIAGRTDPAGIYDHPALLFEDPGLLGSAVEIQVTNAVRECMKEAGFAYRGSAPVGAIGDVVDPEADGYGLGGGAAAKVAVGDGGPGTVNEAAYEEALYGSSLDAEGATAGGCAAVGSQVLDSAVATLRSLPYSIQQLEADAQAHPVYQEALGRWSSCMAAAGYNAASPEELISGYLTTIGGARGQEARALAAGEGAMAAADFKCRRGSIDSALQAVAADLAPAFVERNRAQLETLIPPRGQVVPAVDLGTGDVQVTLRWSSTADLDLEVTDPSGAVINYSGRRSASGGELDRDANYPCDTATGSPVENVFWPPGGAPTGSYTAAVVYRTSCPDIGPQSFEMTIRVRGAIVQQIQETISGGQTLSYDFEMTP